jgi:predicted nucleic acid-binding protein
VIHYVIDNSVAVKWFLPEGHSAHALRLLRSGNQLDTVDLMAAEFTNVLWKNCSSGELAVDEATAILADLRALRLRWHPSLGLADMALTLSKIVGHPAYDCLYVALALRLRCECVTADRRFFSAFTASHPNVVLWVEDLPEA